MLKRSKYAKEVLEADKALKENHGKIILYIKSLITNL